MMKKTNIIEKTFSKKIQQKTIFQKQKKFFKSELKKSNNKITPFVIFSPIIKNFEKKKYFEF